MKKLNKKGFTLIELLAAIVILGVVMGIAVISYNTQIVSSKKNGFVSTANLYIRAIKDQMLSDGVLYSTGNYAYSLANVELSSGGTSPYSNKNYDGYVLVENTVNDDGTTTNEAYICIYDSKNNYVNAAEDDLRGDQKITQGEVKNLTTEVTAVPCKQASTNSGSTVSFSVAGKSIQANYTYKAQTNFN